MNFMKRHALWLLPIFLVALFAPYSAAIDLDIAEKTYHPDTRAFSTNFFYDSMFRYGCIPAQATCAIATLWFLFSFYAPKLVPLRSIMLAVSLSLGIGSGILTIGVFKENWGRPRPRQIEQFGGTEKFRPFYSPSLTKPAIPSKSFPSGHSTCGFYFFILYFIGKRFQKKSLQIMGLLLGLGLGLALSVSRIMQGGHFLSDTLFAAFLMWETAYFVDWLVFDYLLLRKKLAI